VLGRPSDPPITRDEVTSIMWSLMRIEAKADDIRRLLEEMDGEEDEES
jgi:hypothetical protein